MPRLTFVNSIDISRCCHSCNRGQLWQSGIYLKADPNCSRRLPNLNGFLCDPWVHSPKVKDSVHSSYSFCGSDYQDLQKWRDWVATSFPFINTFWSIVINYKLFLKGSRSKFIFELDSGFENPEINRTMFEFG